LYQLGGFGGRELALGPHMVQDQQIVKRQRSMGLAFFQNKPDEIEIRLATG
jgi:hypothetical protein